MHAPVAESADAWLLKSQVSKDVWVQVPSGVPCGRTRKAQRQYLGYCDRTVCEFESHRLHYVRVVELAYTAVSKAVVPTRMRVQIPPRIPCRDDGTGIHTGPRIQVLRVRFPFPILY